MFYFARRNYMTLLKGKMHRIPHFMTSVLKNKIWPQNEMTVCIPWHTYWITFPMFKNWFAHGVNYRAIEVCSVRQIHHWLSEIVKYFFVYSINVLPGIVISLGYCYNELLIHDPTCLFSISPYCSNYYCIPSLGYINRVHMQRIYRNRFTCGFAFPLVFWQKTTSA